MSTEYRDQPQSANTSRINMRSTSRTSNHLPHEAPIEPGHSLSTGLQLVHDQSKEESHSELDDEYGHQFVMKRLKRNNAVCVHFDHRSNKMRRGLISDFLCSWSCSSLDGMMPVKDPYYHRYKSIIMSIIQSVSDPTIYPAKPDEQYQQSGLRTLEDSLRPGYSMSC
jgi:hypothetical protein